MIGEATASIDSSVLEKYDYPWYKVKSFRNFILHEYHAVEMRVIWDTTTEILPGLKEMMEEILTKEF
ncbi:HepT-like ribonuclease domain-containing protein [Imperialibacter sp.]|uniref:HepT-like ribonuclease domain-containing protein n=1 Tax=Imperialibacter sp. TaxID=2038411 RepID=UPI0032EDE6C9